MTQEIKLPPLPYCMLAGNCNPDEKVVPVSEATAYGAECARVAVQEYIASKGDPKARSHIQNVPDHCDRITWRGGYYLLENIATRTAIEDRAQRGVPDGWSPAPGMTAHRAIYFMERFKKEEKLLGPNEQAAVDFVLAMLAAAPEPQGVPEPLAKAKFLLEGWLEGFEDCIEGGEADEMVYATRSCIAQIKATLAAHPQPPAEPPKLTTNDEQMNALFVQRFVTEAPAQPEQERKLEFAEALQAADNTLHHAIDVAQNRVAELERLCDATYVAEGADAYNHACDEMERYQNARGSAGKEVGTTRSLCDGMAWLYSQLDAVEAALAEASKDAERWRYWKQYAREELLRPDRARSDFADFRTHWKGPVLMCSGPVGGYMTPDESADAAIDAMKGTP